MNMMITRAMWETSSSATHCLTINGGGMLIPFHKAHLGLKNNTITIDLRGLDYGNTEYGCETPKEKLTFLIAYLATKYWGDNSDIENDTEYEIILDVLRDYSGIPDIKLKIIYDKHNETYLDHQLMEDYCTICDIIDGKDECVPVYDKEGTLTEYTEKYPNGTGLRFVDFIFNSGVELTFGRD